MSSRDKTVAAKMPVPGKQRPLKKQKLNTTNNTNESIPLETIKKPTHLFDLPNEVLGMIVRAMGPPPPHGVVYPAYWVKDVHPCYALWSTSKFLREIYIQNAPPFSKHLEIYIRAEAYANHPKDSDFTAIIKEALSPLGPYGMQLVKGVGVCGPEINRSSNARIARFLSNRPCRKALSDDELLFVKNHVEQDLRDKAEIMDGGFKAVHVLFGHNITTLQICPGEMPATVFNLALKKYLLLHTDSLELFGVPREVNNRSFPYVRRLTSPYYFDTRAKQPQNYPESYRVHKDQLISMEQKVNEFLVARGTLNTLQGP